ncbi:MAG: ABC transporter permease [Deltaproteobacteria bacterium]|nr:ABC transporter permease [Deltaproteobacteria bacterium]MCB9787908.1 ABC transporter permease [Deltaproteobacteria bacterium]
MVLSSILMAIREIFRNKMRSTLTAIGIVIGVGAVIVVVHLGDATRRSVTASIASMGQNLLFASPGARGRGPGGARTAASPFELADSKAIAQQVPDVTVAPTAGSMTVAIVGNQNWPTTALGVTNEYFAVRDWHVAKGRAFEEAELQGARPVCILGETVEQELFGQAGGLGERVRLGKMSCDVVGVMENKAATMGSDQNDVVLLPLRAFQRRIAGGFDVSTIYLSARDASAMSRVQADVERVLRERRRIKPGDQDDFNVRNMQDIMNAITSTTADMTAFLSAIAAVSLFVGGIGIMNIMLVSVTERTREIGIRLAIGARGREVLLQFLVEAALLATLGGLLGIALGLAGSVIMCDQTGLTFAPVPGILLLSFGFSAAVGVIFGFWPAWKAARMNPIEALRHE